MNIITIFKILLIFLKAISVIQFTTTLLKIYYNMTFSSVLSNLLNIIIELIKL